MAAYLPMDLVPFSPKSLSSVPFTTGASFTSVRFTVTVIESSFAVLALPSSSWPSVTLTVNR